MCYHDNNREMKNNFTSKTNLQHARKNTIIVVQADSREDLPYSILSTEVNKKFCGYLDYNYTFISVDVSKYPGLHPATKKIYIINEALQIYQTEYSVLIFMDTDCWIQNPFKLNYIVEKLLKNKSKFGYFSRDPYLRKNTYINSGSFILKINDYTKKMYASIIYDLEFNTAVSQFKNEWPFDRFFVSK